MKSQKLSNAAASDSSNNTNRTVASVDVARTRRMKCCLLDGKPAFIQTIFYPAKIPLELRRGTVSYVGARGHGFDSQKTSQIKM